MANELSTVLTTKWKKETQHLFAQREAKLNNIGQVIRDVGTGTYNFPVLAATTTAAGPALGSDHAGIAPVHTEVPVTLADRYSNHYLDELTMKKAAESDSLRTAYQRNTIEAINRWCDSTVIAALDALNTTSAATITADGLTITKFLAARELMLDSNVDLSDTFLIVGSQQVSNMLAETKFTSSDYSGSLHKVMSGQIAEVMGVNVIHSSMLTKAVAVRDCFLVNKQALGIVYAADPKTNIKFIDEKDQYFVGTKVSMGAAVIQAPGVIKLSCTEV